MLMRERINYAVRNNINVKVTERVNVNDFSPANYLK